MLEIELIFSAGHSAKIKRGYLRQVAAAKLLIEGGKWDVVLQEHKVSIKASKTKKHKVDIILINHKSKKIILVNSKSDGISHTDPKKLVVQTYIEAIDSVMVDNPGYDVTYIILRTNGEVIPEFEDVGVKTYKTSDYLGITDQEFNDIYQREYEEIILWNIVDQLKKHRISKERSNEIINTCKGLMNQIVSIN